MTDVVVTQQVIEVVITPEDGPDILLTTQAPAEVQIFPVGMQGPPGPSATAQRYRHDQTTASAVWSVNHGLGFIPQVSVFNAGSVLLPIAAVTNPSVNQTIVTFNVAQTGFVLCL